MEDDYPLRVGSYVVFEAFAQGGLATVHLGVRVGAAGFSRVVAIKRLLPQHASDLDLSTSFIDEARLSSRIRHPRVVVIDDVIALGHELLLVMEYVHGDALSTLLARCGQQGTRPDPAVAVAIVCDVLAGLDAAHNARS